MLIVCSTAQSARQAPSLALASSDAAPVHAQKSKGGKAGLFILGTGLIIYGLFATLNGLYVREFPTRVPSGVPMGYVPRMINRLSMRHMDVP